MAKLDIGFDWKRRVEDLWSIKDLLLKGQDREALVLVTETHYKMRADIADVEETLQGLDVSAKSQCACAYLEELLAEGVAETEHEDGTIHAVLTGGMSLHFLYCPACGGSVPARAIGKKNNT